jgi:nucleoside-diphosphate-sugar epimerase
LAKKLVSEGWLVDVVDDMSNGSIDVFNDSKIRVLPNSTFIQPYYNSLTRSDGQPISSPMIKNSRSKDTILVIEDDYAAPGICANIKNKRYDVIFHQAAIPRVSYSVENPSETTHNNILKTVMLFEACVDSVDRVVWASSSSVYGGADTLPTPESERGKNLPKSPYAWQKFAIEDYAKICADLYDLDIVCLRYFNVFGPGQLGDSPYSTAVAAWCHATKNGLPLRSDGDGEQTRDMCYIDNTVHANILAANSTMKFRGRCYNVACGNRVSNNEILSFFRSNFDIQVNHAPERPGDVKHTCADITRINEELGYKPLITFWEGLEETIDWWGLE